MLLRALFILDMAINREYLEHIELQTRSLDRVFCFHASYPVAIYSAVEEN